MNSDPAITTGYFQKPLKEHQGCPCVVSADAGTANCRVTDSQESMTGNNDNNNAHKKTLE